MTFRDERLHAIFESAKEAVVSTDTAGSILEFNRRAAEMFVSLDSAAVGKSLAELIVAPDQRSRFSDILQSVHAAPEKASHRDWLPVSGIDGTGNKLMLEIAIQLLQSAQEAVFVIVLRKSPGSARPAATSHQTNLQGASSVGNWHQLQELMLLASDTGTFEETLQFGLRMMCEVANWPIGHVWIPESGGEFLSLSDIWHVRNEPLYSSAKSSRNGSRLNRGEDLAGRIWDADAPAWISDIGADSSTSQLHRFSEFGLQGAFGFPIHVHRETVAVFVFLSPDSTPPSPETLLWAHTIENQLGRVLERRRWEAERLRLAAIVDSAYDAIIGKSLDGVITSWNAGAEATYGYTSREALGQSARMLIPEQFGNHEPELADITRYGRQFNQFETIRRRKDGRNIDVTMTVSPVRDGSGRLVGTSSIERDTTHRRRREDELKQATRAAEIASRTKNEFLANVSHELRTPMNAIIGMVELSLATNGLVPIVRDYLATASESAHVLLSLLDDLLDFSRMEAGHFELDPQPFSLRQTLEEAMRILSLRAHERGLELACEIQGDVPDRLEGDSRRLRQIIMNLAGNSIKFTEQGEVVVQVSVESHRDSEVQLLISVRDTGIGIAQDDQQRIFAPFTQVDASTTRRFAGTGLGLSICSELIERMGGKIWLDSDRGAGTTFYCTPRFHVLPNLPNDDEAIVRELHDLDVLIVDDNATNRRILEQSLNSWSMKPVAVEDGESALRQIEQAVREGRPYPLLIVDGLMPVLDGFTLIETLQNRGLAAGAKILMLSSADRNTFEDRCRNLPVNAYLEKPVSQSMLLDAVMTALCGPQLRFDAVAKISATPAALNILVAEDTPANQRVVQAILERRGHHVTIAHNGREAIDLHERAPYDIILMDVQMPTMDGLQATSVIRSLDDDLARVPIIAMTAHAMRGDRERCLATGMTSYISKPIDANQLVKLVERVFREHRHSQGACTPLPHINTPVKTMVASFPPDPLKSAPISPGDNPELLEERSRRPPVFPAKPVLNVASALSRLGGDQGLLHDMASFYLEDSDKLLVELQAALQQEDGARAMRHAHSLKGLSANFSAEPCVAIAFAVEDACCTGDLATARELLCDLKSEVARLTVALQQEVLNS